MCFCELFAVSATVASPATNYPRCFKDKSKLGIYFPAVYTACFALAGVRIEKLDCIVPVVIAFVHDVCSAGKLANGRLATADYMLLLFYIEPVTAL